MLGRSSFESSSSLSAHSLDTGLWKIRIPAFDENHPNNPMSTCGVSKLVAENYCNVFWKSKALNLPI